LFQPPNETELYGYVVEWRNALSAFEKGKNALLEKYGKSLLEKYKFEIYEDRIKDIDPLNIP
jgi:hypothetical protein